MNDTAPAAGAGEFPDEPETGHPPTDLLPYLSRELRTRLSPASAAIEGLTDATVAWTDEQRSELLDLAHTALKQVGLLLRELDAAQAAVIGASAAHTQATALPELLDAAITDLGQGAQPPRTQLPPALPLVLGDPTILRLLLGSLLRHAQRGEPSGPPDVRAAPRGSRLMLRIGQGAPASDHWQDDNGQAARRARPHDRKPPLSADLAVARGLAQLIHATLRTEQDAPDAAAIVELAVAPPASAHNNDVPAL